MSKVTNTTIDKTKTITPSKATTSSWTQYELYTITEYADKISWNISYQTSNYYENAFAYVYKSDWTQSWSKNPISWHDYSWVVEFTNIDIDRWSVVKVWYKYYQYSDTVTFNSNLTYTYHLYKNLWEKRWIRSNSVQNIWDLVNCTTFWRHIDGSWWNRE